ncbi:uncharacterized protein C11orf98 homolog [Gadus chalcogrammus]|uniref:uncharacterized protein C11orf98 homolog n=1 Tax=Gadus chalcogrammus TaxID=1042646 RepID=UPI0024C24F5E|nr:uncharacterized protein C11orf98 homolog [Gadus chalcogrammus]
MGSTPGGKINRPKTDLGRNICKRRRVQGKQKRQRHQITGAVIDAGLTTIHHLKKRITSKRANITLSGKKKNKLLKQLAHMEREKAGMDVAPSAAPKTQDPNTTPAAGPTPATTKKARKRRNRKGKGAAPTTAAAAPTAAATAAPTAAPTAAATAAPADVVMQDVE